jgi:hypothetical protein
VNREPHRAADLLEHPGVRAQLGAAVQSLDIRHSTVFATVETDEDKRAQVADYYADGLRSPDAAGQGLALEVMEMLMARDLHGSFDFWASPLGQAVAWHIGHHAEYAPRMLAGAALGFKESAARQRVQQLIAAGQLVGGPDGVAADSLAKLMQRRWP